MVEIYRLRFVLDGMRSLFPLLALKCTFMFKSNSLVNPKDFVFFWCRQDQKATGGAEIYIFYGLEK